MVDHPSAQGGEVARAGDNVVQVQQQFFHGATRLMAGSGDADMARAAVEQGDTQPIFQLLNLNRECRRRQMQLDWPPW